MPTYRALARFWREFDKLTPEQQARFYSVVALFVADTVTGQFRKGLRVKRVQGTKDVFEITWAPDGRATWQYGDPIRRGVPHIVWRRIGGHDIFGDP